MLVDEATAFDFEMQMANQSFDGIGVGDVSDSTEAENENMLDNLWYERRDGTLDEKNHEPMFHEELPALFKKTETIKQCRTDITVFPTPAQALDAQADLVSPTLALLLLIARDIVRMNTEYHIQTCQSWHKVLEEPLTKVAERHVIPFTIFLNNISAYWRFTIPQMESNVDD